MQSNLKRLSFKHKNNKFWYYLVNAIRICTPTFFYKKKLPRKLSDYKNFDKEYIQKRVDYYNRLPAFRPLPDDATTLSKFTLGKNNKTYYFDTYEYIRFFDQSYKILVLLGDITHVPAFPSITKSRPIHGDNTNSILLNLDKIRHFLFLKDKNDFIKKKNMLVWRTKAYQEHRIRFLQMYFRHPLCDIGQVNRDINPQFVSNRMTIVEHLRYKYILCLEGWDVATNLKWVMSSNSVAVMPKPQYETWFMEGSLVPNFHYIEIKEDYSDLEERLSYYNAHPHEALHIIENAHQYVAQFKNKAQEDIISLLVLQKYFDSTGQKTQ